LSRAGDLAVLLATIGGRYNATVANRKRTRRSRGPLVISAATTPTRTPPPPDVLDVDPKRPATALHALDAIAIRCYSMSISFAGHPTTPPPLPAIHAELGRPRPTGVSRLQASIEAGRRFLRDPLQVKVSFKNVVVAWGWARTTRQAFGIIRRVRKFRVDPDTLSASISRGPVDAATFRELARLALVAGLGVEPASAGRKTARQLDPVVQLEQAFARASQVYIRAATPPGSWFDIRSQPRDGGGKRWEGNFSPRVARPRRAETFADMIDLLAALPRKPTIKDVASLSVQARGSGLGGDEMTKLLVAVLDRVLGPRRLLRSS
jgi:hypothetical protein